MSTIKDVGTELAQRVAAERAKRGWSLADLAARSDVSRSMLSKIEREEASPTASVLVRIAAAFDLTLAELLMESAPQAKRFLSAPEQEVWVDPETGYRRRQIYLSAQLPLELVEVLLPAGAKVTMAESAYLRIRQVVWLLKGRLSILEGDVRTVLKPGDRLEFGPPADCTFLNESSEMCRYLVAVVRR